VSGDEAGGGSVEVSEDALLGGRIKFFQPVQGYRAAIDPIILAASVPAGAGEEVLDVGAGAGAAALCLAARIPGVSVTGLECQAGLVDIARRNGDANGLGDRVKFVHGDLLDGGNFLRPHSFHHVMANPPFTEAGRGNTSPHPGKARANVEGQAALADWIDFCLTMARPKGTVCVIHRAGRLDAVLAALAGRVGGIVVYPLWPGPGGKPAKRVVVRGRLGAAAPLKMSAGLMLHELDGSYTGQAEAVLRHAQGLEL
jgi:tRNA1(Val) A37 N6-methylase TrmN6